MMLKPWTRLRRASQKKKKKLVTIEKGTQKMATSILDKKNSMYRRIEISVSELSWYMVEDKIQFQLYIFF